jgi:hypothetical protein
MRLNREQIKEAIERVFNALSEGSDEADLQNELGMSIVEYEKLKKDMMEAKSEEIVSRPVEHIFVQYIIDQIKNISDLTDIIEEHKHTKSVNAAVSAIRIRSEITDKIIETGQSFGIIHKEADRKEVTGGFTVAQLTSDQLKTAIMDQLKNLNRMMSTYGDDASIIDIEPGEIHMGPANTAMMLEPPKEAPKEKNKYSKSKNNKRSGGRVRTRTKVKVGG